jgi:hypothetical protein
LKPGTVSVRTGCCLFTFGELAQYVGQLLQILLRGGTLGPLLCHRGREQKPVDTIAHVQGRITWFRGLRRIVHGQLRL